MIGPAQRLPGVRVGSGRSASTGGRPLLVYGEPGVSGTAIPASSSPDLALGAFTEQGPWVVDPDRLVWLPGLDRVRARTRAEVPRLLDPGTGPAGRPPGARSLALVGVAVGTWYVRERGTPASRAGISRRLRRAFERLGSTYVKLGQIVSAFEGLFPDELVDEFKKLRDQVPPEPFAVVRDVVERELGRPLDAVFSEFAEEPIAAASIAQVARGPAASPARRSSSRSSGRRSPRWSVPTSGRWPGWRPGWSAGSRSPRSPTRRRSSSCSPSRSSRSSTSASRPRTCSTWPGCSR